MRKTKENTERGGSGSCGCWEGKGALTKRNTGNGGLPRIPDEGKDREKVERTA